MKKVLFFLILFFNANAIAEVYKASGKVTKIITFSFPYEIYNETQPSMIGIYVEGLPIACGSGGKTRVAISDAHPAYNAALSLATTAYVTGKSVEVGYVNTCTVRSNSWDFAYLLLK